MEELHLGNLSPNKGSHTARKRLGRGMGSGLGKTAGKGHKGQKARKGGGIAPGFEGGQTPLYRRLPKRGFTNLRTKKKYTLIRLEQLNVFADGAKIDKGSLHKEGLLRNVQGLVKILCKGELKKKLSINVDSATFKITAGAKKALLDNGGSVEEK